MEGLGQWGSAARAAACCGLAFAASLAGKVLAAAWRLRAMRRALRNVPKLDHVEDPLFGSIPGLVKNLRRRHDFIMEASRFRPASWWRGVFFDPYSVEILVLDPAGVKHFLKDNFENYTKPASSRNIFFCFLREWLGGGIFVARHGTDAEDGGRGWSRQRKIAASIFTRSNFNSNMTDVFVAKGQRLCELLAAPAETGSCADMQSHFFSYTMDSIMQIFFGEASDTLGGELNKYAQAYDTAHRSIVEFSMRSLKFLAVTSVFPWPLGGGKGCLAWQLCMATSPLYREFRLALGTLDRESRRLVAACRSDPHLAERKDLLALFVQAEEKERFTPEWLRDVVLNFVIAGRDTTACMLSWMFYIVATNPKVQAALCAEVDAKLPHGVLPSPSLLAHGEMPYLHGVLYETLRLYPPVPSDGKEAVADDVLPDGTPVPRHANLFFHPYTMGRDPRRWPDPTAVVPERWIPFKEPLPHEFPVFQAGPRICLGMGMAVLEAKIVASMLLRDYAFELAPGEAEKITYLGTALTMSICNSKTEDSHNLWLIPSRRQRPAGCS